MKKIIVFAAIVAAVFAGVCVGEFFGSSHKDSERRLAFERGYRDGFESGIGKMAGLLGVPYGGRCEVRGNLSFPLRGTKRGDGDGIYTLDAWEVNGKRHCASVNVVLGSPEEASRIIGKLGFGGSGRFVGYETLEAVGIPTWLNDGELCSTDYSIENRFVITEVMSDGKGSVQ